MWMTVVYTSLSVVSSGLSRLDELLWWCAAPMLLVERARAAAEITVSGCAFDMALAAVEATLLPKSP